MAVTSRLSIPLLEIAQAGKETVLDGWATNYLDNAGLVTQANTWTLTQTVAINDASGSAVTRPLVITHTNSGGVGAAGIGAGLELRAENTTEGSTAAAGRLDAVLTTVTAAAEVSRLDLSVLDAGASVTPLSVATKQVTIGQVAQASANFGLLSVGGGGFAGGGGTNYAGSAQGTLFAGNAASGFTGNLLDVQLAGVSKLAVSTTGTVTLADGANLVTGTTTGLKIGTATTQKLAFFNSSPIVQPANTTDLRTALINLGLYASGGASPLNLNGGLLTAATVAANSFQGSGTAFALKRFSLTFPSDADYTLAAGELDAPLLDVQTGVITATRNIIVPGTGGGTYFVINRNGQAITLKTASSAGITVASARSAIICFPGGTVAFRLAGDTNYAV